MYRLFYVQPFHQNIIKIVLILFLVSLRASIHVSVLLPPLLFRKLPRELQDGRTVKVIPLIFTQGINEHATLAEK